MNNVDSQWGVFRQFGIDGYIPYSAYIGLVADFGTEVSYNDTQTSAGLRGSSWGHIPRFWSWAYVM